MRATQSLEVIDAAGHEVDEYLLEARVDRRDLDMRLSLLHRAYCALKGRGILAACMNLRTEARDHVDAFGVLEHFLRFHQRPAGDAPAGETDLFRDLRGRRIDELFAVGDVGDGIA